MGKRSSQERDANYLGGTMSEKPDQLRPSLLSVSVGAAIASMAVGAVSPSAHAQEVQLEEIVVTGSRIVRRDYVSNSPIVTIESDQFESQNGLNFERYLNQLPNYNPASTPTTTQFDVQITPVNSVGVASISLRGFGPNRSLVLVDGRRQVPINSLMVTDVNGIPSALIERVETITGGASAVYGADAVGGVTNFILRDDFEGFEFDAQYGTTSEGGGEESRVSAVFGADFDDGRGNIAMGVEAYNREAVLEIDRDAYTDRYLDPNAEGTFGFLVGTSHYNQTFGPFPSSAAVNAVFDDRPAGTNVFNPATDFFPALRQYNFNADGETVWVAGSEAGLSNYTPQPGQDFFPYNTIDNTVGANAKVMEGLKWHNERALVSAPQERYSFFASGNYDLTDNVRVFARGTMAESETRTVLFGTSVIFGWETTVPYNPATDSPLDPALDYNDEAVVAAAIADPTNPAYANPNFIATGQPGAGHPVPLQLAALLNSRPMGTYCLRGSSPTCGAPGTGTYVTDMGDLVGIPTTGDWLVGWNPDLSLPPRSTVNTNTVWQFETGLEFDLPADWTGELYLSHGQSSTYNNAAGNLSLTRYRALVREADYGRNAEISGNATGASPGFGAADITCTSGFYNTYFAGDAPLSQDCFNAVNATLQTRAQNTQDIVELNFQGGLGELPAGEVRMAAGYQRRENGATFVPDILQSTSSFTDQVVGVYPTGYMDAETSVDDLYLEFLVPLLANKPAFQLLELELGARTSDYEHTDKENTYKALINWQVNDWMRFRGGFNRASRAPNLGELFLAEQEIFTIGGNNFGDPCALRSTAPYGAGGTGTDPVVDPPDEPPPQLASGQTAQGAQSARLICEAMMSAAGLQQFYFNSNAAPGGGSAFNFVKQQGNPGLVSETADSWTFGFVMNSPFESPWLRGATLSLDYYRIEIEDAIMLFSVDFANFRCFGAEIVTDAAGAAARAASPECQLVPRNAATGGPLTTALSYDNQATLKTAGVDIGLNWMLDFGDLSSGRQGGIGLNLQATWLDYYRSKQSPADFDVETEWKGSLGPTLTGTNPGAYDYRLFSTFSYFRNDWTVNLRWRYLPGVHTADYASLQAVMDHNARVAAGGPGIILSYTPSDASATSPRNARATEIESDSYSIFDLSFNYNISDSLRLRAGITNLLDEEPVEIGSTTGYPVGTDLTSICGGAPGCVDPTFFSLPETGGGAGGAAFSGGYYDTIGRSYFLGFDYRF
jgi:outer membrane receptor protein involved in Fe transport